MSDNSPELAKTALEAPAGPVASNECDVLWVVEAVPELAKAAAVAAVDEAPKGGAECMASPVSVKTALEDAAGPVAPNEDGAWLAVEAEPEPVKAAAVAVVDEAPKSGAECVASVELEVPKSLGGAVAPSDALVKVALAAAVDEELVKVPLAAGEAPKKRPFAPEPLEYTGYSPPKRARTAGEGLLVLSLLSLNVSSL